MVINLEAVKLWATNYTQNMNLPFLYVFSTSLFLYSTVTVSMLNIIYDVQPKPFIDEVFHVRQAITYCNGSFHEWDPKITTLPGLYFVSVGLLKPVSWLFQNDFCDLYGLRFINVLCSICNFCLFYSIRSRICKSEKDEDLEWKSLFAALNMGFFPVMYFFSFLYYTDLVSMLFVLLTYRLFLAEKFCMSAVMGAFAVFCRQTNIVWVGFFALQICLDCIQKHLQKLNRNRREPLTWKSILNSIMDMPHIHIPLVREVLNKEISYIVVMALFTSFVYINKGIVVGDRQAHEAVLNIPQLFYFYLFVIAFAFPYALVLVGRYIIFARKDTAFVCGLGLIAISVTALYTHVHPYLLADNRHYTFYIWKRVYERHWSIRYLLTPVYVFGAFCVNSFISHKKFSFKIAFDMCVIVSLIPQKLLEFRYFILPYMIMRLNLKLEDWWQLIFELAIYLSYNNSAFQTFALKTFYWNDSPDVQRIIW